MNRESGSRYEGREATHMRVFVLDRHKRPLMPTTPKRARKMLEAGRARVHKVSPFTIRLVDRVVEKSEVEGVELGIDPGSKVTGLAVFDHTSDGARRGLVLIELEHRGAAIRKKMEQRASYRRRRRSANLRYRAPRFNNRTKPDGWLAPSLRHRVETTTSWVDRLTRLAPVRAVHVEAVSFDTHLLSNPDVSGVGYAHGELHGYEVREYLFVKLGRKCVYCDIEDVPLNIDHIHPRSRGGSDRVSNLTVACIRCNQAKGASPVEEFVTDPARLVRIKARSKAPMRDAAAVNSTRNALVWALGDRKLDVHTSTGGRTKWNRSRLGVPKTHALDALCVGVVDDVASWPATRLDVKACGRGSYSRTTTDAFGFARLRRPRTKLIRGFATGDLVVAHPKRGKYAGLTIRGRVACRSTGSFRVGKFEAINHSFCRVVQRADGYQHTRSSTMTSHGAIPPRSEGRGFLAVSR